MRRRRASPKVIALLLLFLLTTSLLLCWRAVESQLQPIVERYSENGAKTQITRCVNDAIADCLTDPAMTAGLIGLQTDEEGAVTRLETDAARTNALRIAVTDAVLAKLKATDIQSLAVPLGTLLGSELLGGRGPKLELRVSTNHAVTTAVRGEWRSAGINQTAHSLYLTVQVDTVLALAGNRQTTQSVSCEYLLTETILVGKVPNVYAGSSSVRTQSGETAG